jgi:hypothetical protein
MIISPFIFPISKEDLFLNDESKEKIHEKSPMVSLLPSLHYCNPYIPQAVRHSLNIFNCLFNAEEMKEFKVMASWC